MPLLAAIILQAQAAVFAPPLGVPIRVVTERTQGEDPSRFTVHVERLVRFSRDGIGYRAEVVLTAASASPREDAGTMLQAGFAGLAGRTMVFRVDAAGKVVAVDDRQALWDRFCDSILAVIVARTGHGSQAEHVALAERMAAPLRGFSPERQQAMLGSLVSALVAEEPGAAPGTRPIRLPGNSPFGGKVELAGTRTVTPAGHTTTRAAAEVPQQGGAHIELETEDDTDPRTGLVTAHAETLRTTIGEGANARTTERISTVRVTVDPATAWPGSSPD